MICAVLALLMLPSCEKGSADGYQFGQRGFTHLTPDIEFVEHQSQQELVAAAPATTRNDIKNKGGELLAWSVLKGPNHNICVVHIVNPQVKYAPELIGHEVAHCIYGRWHA
jgi:hypothetical protein